MSKNSKDGLRDIARARPDEIATREIRGCRIEPRRNYPQLKGQICTEMEQ